MSDTTLLGYLQGNLTTQACSASRDDEDFPFEIRDVSFGIECVAAAKHLDK